MTLKPNNRKLLLPLVGAAALPFNLLAQSVQQRYNVVFIMTDDHTAQMMSCYDNRNVQTPNLDRVAANGVKFVNSFVANSLSGPSRACMLTGKHSHKNGFVSNEMSVFDSSQQTMPKLLQKAGYQTALFGKWHLGTLPTGFDAWKILPGQGDYYAPTFINMDKSREVIPGYVTNVVTDLGLQWLETQRDPSKPFILFMQHKACHRNWLPETKYLREYEDHVFPLPSTFYDDYANRPAAAAQEMEIGKDMDMANDVKIYRKGDRTRLSEGYLHSLSKMTPAERAVYDSVYDKITADYYSNPPATKKALAEYKFQRYMRDYAKVVKSLDDNVGRVLDYLEAKGLSENTLVIYTSDQGFYMGEHGWFDKRFIYEESLRTPLVIALPKGFKGKGDIVPMVQNIDYAPTILELAGAPIPADIQGRSFLSLLKGEKPKQWRKGVYYHFHEYPAEHAVKRHYGIRTERYKLIHFYNDIDVWELYDLKKDPHELNNLYGKPGTEKLTQKLRKQLWDLQVQYDDPIRLKYPLN